MATRMVFFGAFWEDRMKQQQWAVELLIGHSAQASARVRNAQLLPHGRLVGGAFLFRHGSGLELPTSRRQRLLATW